MEFNPYNQELLRVPCIYPEHNYKYFKQCYYNLEEKHDRGIISDEEWKPINDLYWEIEDRGFY